MKKEVATRGQPYEAGRPKTLRVLIADDDRDSMITLAMLLREEGHQVRMVISGKQALQVAWEFDPDVALLDIQLPQLSGWEVARQIRGRRGRDRPLIIGISGEYKSGPDKILSEIVGFDHYLLKPYDPNALLALIAPLRLPQPGT